MLAAYQIINKILQTKDYSIVKRNGLEASQFSIYGEQFQFIVDHYKKNGNVPDMLTFQSYFPDFTFNEVYETDDYLMDRLYEENGYQKWSEILPTLNQKIKEDSRLAYDFMKEQMQSTLKPKAVCKGVNIIENAIERYDEYLNKQKGISKPAISSGLPELDEIFGGWEAGDELITIVGRTGEGKSWTCTKFLTEAWKQEKRVGIYSGEMGPSSIGYRFDSILKHFSNSSLNRGSEIVGYTEYINELRLNKTPYFIITPKELGGRPTVNQLRPFIENNNLDILAVDQLSLMEDGRSSKYDPPRIKMGHIAEDLFQLSGEYGIPIIALAQANRESLKKGSQDAPGVENISESDGIPHNSSKVIGIRKINDKMIIDIGKNRNGKSGGKLTYLVNFNTGYMEYQPIEGDAALSSTRDRAYQNNMQKFSDATNINPF